MIQIALCSTQTIKQWRSMRAISHSIILYASVGLRLGVFFIECIMEILDMRVLRETFYANKRYDPLQYNFKGYKYRIYRNESVGNI